jgi:hypothetical protein
MSSNFIKRALYLVIQKISHRYIKDTLESPEIDYRALPDFSSELVEIIIIIIP